jgi:hypothetical protein
MSTGWCLVLGRSTLAKYVDRLVLGHSTDAAELHNIEDEARGQQFSFLPHSPACEERATM